MLRVCVQYVRLAYCPPPPQHPPQSLVRCMLDRRMERVAVTLVSLQLPHLHRCSAPFSFVELPSFARVIPTPSGLHSVCSVPLPLPRMWQFLLMVW